MDRRTRRLVASLLVLCTLVPATTHGALADASPLPACTARDGSPLIADRRAMNAGYGDWRRTVLDTLYALPRDYAPSDLVSVTRAGLAGSGLVRSFVIADLRAMVLAARADGVRLAVQSAYRSYADQVATFAHWVAVDGYAAALETSARPGHSEHQLGTAIDFRDGGGSAPWDVGDWATTPAGAWLSRNARRFGFALSYPAGASAVSCYSYEPWHYRYLGRTEASAIAEVGTTTREWLWADASLPGTTGGRRPVAFAARPV